MAVISLNPQGTEGATKDFVVLPSDVYRMKIIKSSIEENRFAEPDKKTGKRPEQLVLVWEVTQLTEEQIDAAAEAGEDWSTAQVWHRMSPWYGEGKNGASKFKTFLDSLRKQGYFEDLEGDFDTDLLVGVEQRISIEHYIKGQGENTGKPGNKVVSVLPLKRNGTKKAAAIEVAELPF